MYMQGLLLKIRQKRYENAQVEVARSRAALIRAQQKLLEAEQAAEAFGRQLRARIANIYNALIGKKIFRSKLDEARNTERSLHEKLAAMKADVKICADQVEEKRVLLSEAQSHLMASHKGLEKAQEIYQQAVDENLRAEVMREDKIIDEFAGRMRS